MWMTMTSFLCLTLSTKQERGVLISIACVNPILSVYTSSTPNPDAAAAGVQFQRTSHDDAAWHRCCTTHSQIDLSNWCDAHTLDSLMEEATQGDRNSLELHQVHGSGSLVSGRNPPPTSLTGKALQHRLRIPFLAEDTQCPAFVQVLDRCDGATVYPRADPNHRHNAVATSTKPHRKQGSASQRAGLFQLRPDTDGFRQRASCMDLPWRPDPRSLGLCGHFLPPPSVLEPRPTEFETHKKTFDDTATGAIRTASVSHKRSSTDTLEGTLHAPLATWFSPPTAQGTR